MQSTNCQLRLNGVTEKANFQSTAERLKPGVPGQPIAPRTPRLVGTKAAAEFPAVKHNQDTPDHQVPFNGNGYQQQTVRLKW